MDKAKNEVDDGWDRCHNQPPEAWLESATADKGDEKSGEATGVDACAAGTYGQWTGAQVKAPFGDLVAGGAKGESEPRCSE